MKIKSSIIRDTLELTDNHGEIVKTIPFTTNVTRTASEVQAKRLELAKAEEADAETKGRITVELFALIFGEDATNKLLEHYEGDYTAMIADIVPYIVEYILPLYDEVRDKIVKAKKSLKRG